MHTRLLVDSIDECRLGALLRVEDAGHVELEALGDLVLELELSAEGVGGGPGLGDDETLLIVGILGLQVAIDCGRARIARATDAEGDAGGGFGLDFKRGAEDGEVLAQEVVGALAEVLNVAQRRHRHQHKFFLSTRKNRTFQFGGTGWGRLMVKKVKSGKEG